MRIYSTILSNSQATNTTIILITPVAMLNIVRNHLGINLVTQLHRSPDSYFRQSIESTCKLSLVNVTPREFRRD